VSRHDESLNLWTLFDIPSIEEGGVQAYLNTILVKCAEWFGASIASIFVADEQGIIRCQAAIGTAITREAIIEPGRGIAGSALQHGIAMLVEDPRQNPLLAGQVEQRRHEIGSAMVIPLVSSGRKLGVLNLAKQTTDQPFDEDDLTKANTLAHHISLAVANWRLIGEIQSAHDQIRSVFNLLGVAVFVIRNSHVVKRNPEAERLVGRGQYYDILASLPRSLAEGVDQAVHEAEQFQRMKVQAQHEDITWTISSAPLPDGGVVLMIEDVSSTVKTTQELSRVKRLAEIGQMTAAIAHEIRNPLTGIRSAAQMVAIAPEQAEELAQMIEEEALKLNDLCSQFLDFAKPAELVLSQADLASIAQRLAAVHAQDFDQAQIKLVVEANESNHGRMDRNQMEQVMRNLLLNALQATSIRGTVTLKTYPNGFEVVDTGHGMDDETVQKLFMPFFTTKPKGTGLGLSTCRKIVEAHEGVIEVQSELGKGSRFRVQFANNREVAA
jgi:signal transduction histidine kinase